MSFGGLTSVGHFGSSAVMNQKLNHAMTGSEIAALTSTQKKKGMQILCTLSESGYTANHLYIIAADDTTVLDMGLIDHTHEDTNTGGFIMLIDRANAGFYYNYLNLAPTAGVFFTSTGTGGGGTVTSTNEALGTVMDTSATSGGYATSTLSGVRLDYGFPSVFKVKLRATSNTNFTQCRVGVGQEHANESNTSVRKFGIESCSSSGVNWLVNSSDNTTRTTVSTSIGVSQAGPDCYTVDSTLINITAVYGANTNMAVKTSNLPVTGQSGTQVFRAGLKNTAAESKQLQLMGLQVQGAINDLDWVRVATPY